MRVARVRVTDYRKAPAVVSGNARAASRRGLDILEERQNREAKEHDKWVGMLDMETLLCAAHDLGERMAHDRKDPEQRWVMGRKAAILRRLCGMRGKV